MIDWQQAARAKPVLKPGVLYSADNGRVVCSRCAGESALYRGVDVSGMRVLALGAEEIEAFESAGIKVDHLDCSNHLKG